MKVNPRIILEGRTIVGGYIDGNRKKPFVAALLPIGWFPNIATELGT
jgi:hypothetical protein